eukprot:CAMPEP_0178398568 /NCGR_PEP_ID=MMETSP0689_2-20121128/14840_1 /TAXON_ID=160604 /ORGANISM="Amphidinium massartii, Strain CS-259" /LENGTH=684 /DNA_ID=CAMNT_0020019335 /DNA_START=13 /DNA_END=2068 /DNA_ORIENTATION=+
MGLFGSSPPTKGISSSAQVRSWRYAKLRAPRASSFVSEVLCAPMLASRDIMKEAQASEPLLATPTTNGRNKHVGNEDLLAMLGDIANGTGVDHGDDDVSMSASAVAMTGGTSSVGSPGVGHERAAPHSASKGTPDRGDSSRLEEEQVITRLSGDELRQEVGVLAAQVTQQAHAQEHLKRKLEVQLSELRERSAKKGEEKETLRERLGQVKDTLSGHLREAEDVENRMVQELENEKSQNAALEEKVTTSVNEFRAMEAALRLELQQVTEAHEPLVNDLSKALAAQAETQAQLQAERAATWKKSTKVMMAFARGASTISEDGDAEEVKKAMSDDGMEAKAAVLEAEDSLSVIAAQQSVEEDPSRKPSIVEAHSAAPSIASAAAEDAQVWRGLSGLLLGPLLRRLRTSSDQNGSNEVGCLSGASASRDRLPTATSELGESPEPQKEGTLSADVASVAASIHGDEPVESNLILDLQDMPTSTMDKEQWIIAQRNCELSKALALEEQSLSQLQALLDDASQRAAACGVTIDQSNHEEAMKLYEEAGGAKDAGIDAAKSVAHTQALSRALQDATERLNADTEDIKQVRAVHESKQAELEELRKEVVELRSELVRRTATWREAEEKEAALQQKMGATQTMQQQSNERLRADLVVAEKELARARKETERLERELAKRNNGIFSCLRAPDSGR